MPPIDMLRDAVLQSVLVPLVAAAIVYLLFLFVPRGNYFTYFGAALAIVVGFLAGHFFRDAIELTEKPRAWLKWCVLVACLVGWIGRLPWMPRSLLRFAVALAAGTLLSTGEASTNWQMPIFVLLIATEWELLEAVGERSPGGMLPLAMAIVFAAAALVSLYAATSRYADAALILAAATLGIALVAWLRRGDASGIAPIVAVGLPGLMLIVRDQTTSEVPMTAFLAMALAPLGLIPAAMLSKCGCGPKWLRSLAIVIGPTAIAAVGIVLAAMYESLPE